MSKIKATLKLESPWCRPTNLGEIALGRTLLPLIAYLEIVWLLLQGRVLIVQCEEVVNST